MAVLGIALVGCQADPQDRQAPAQSAEPDATKATTTATTTAAAAVTDACVLLPRSAVLTAVGATGATTSSTRQGTFLTCEYSLHTSKGTGRLILDVSTSRGEQVYLSAADAAGFEPVDGLGGDAEYSPEQARLVSTAGDVFLQISMPPYLPGGALPDPGTTRAAAVTLAQRVYQSLS